MVDSVNPPTMYEMIRASRFRSMIMHDRQVLSEIVGDSCNWGPLPTIAEIINELRRQENRRG